MQTSYSVMNTPESIWLHQTHLANASADMLLLCEVQFYVTIKTKTDK